MYDHYSIPSRMNVQLDTSCAELDRALEGGNGILGQCVVRSPVGDWLGRLKLLRGQFGSLVTSFTLVSAKV